MHGAKELRREIETCKPNKCRKQPRLSQFTFTLNHVPTRAEISADVAGNTRIVLAALPYKVAISTMLVILT